jgi:heme/copper-type cytochrome/quinol oxidase subunit 2
MATKLQSYHEPVTLLWHDKKIDDYNIDVDDDDDNIDNIIALMTVMLLIIVGDVEIIFVSNYHQNDDQIK